MTKYKAITCDERSQGDILTDQKRWKSLVWTMLQLESESRNYLKCYECKMKHDSAKSLAIVTLK